MHKITKALAGAAHHGSTVYVTGATGRLGRNVVANLKSKGHNVFTESRGSHHTSSNDALETLISPAKRTINQWKEFFDKHNIKTVVNLAASTPGKSNKKRDSDLATMREVNAQMPKNMALAMKGTDKKLIHISSSSTQIAGIDKNTPYAYTKAEAEKDLKEIDNNVIVRLSAVLGSKSDVPVFSDAAVSKWFPVVFLPPKGEKSEFFPVDEATVIDVLEKLVDECQNPEGPTNPLPKEIDVAGHGVNLKDFLKMVNPLAIGTVRIPATIINQLSKLVNAGVFTEEFIRLSDLMAKENIKAPDISAMESILGVKSPTPEEVAKAAQSQLSFLRNFAIFGHSITKIVDDKTHDLVHTVSDLWDHIQELM